MKTANTPCSTLPWCAGTRTPRRAAEAPLSSLDGAKTHAGAERLAGRDDGHCRFPIRHIQGIVDVRNGFETESIRAAAYAHHRARQGPGAADFQFQRPARPCDARRPGPPGKAMIDVAVFHRRLLGEVELAAGLDPLARQTIVSHHPYAARAKCEACALLGEIRM